MPAKAKKRDQEVTVGNRRLKLTNLDKVLYPKTKTTKAEVIDYYARVADLILPHLKGRPLTLKRYPDGVDRFNFYEKNCPKHRPDWVKTTPIYVDRRAGEIDFCLCENRATLIWMAQLASLELHPSLSKATRMEQPTVLAFDLDPGPPAGLVECCKVALRVRDLFGAFGLEGFPKVSGGKGLQVYFPLNTKVSYEQTSPFAKAVAQLLEKQTPKDVVSKMAKVDRRGKVFVDWSQNHQKKTTIAVYSLRAREHPTASVPLQWREVERTAKGGDTEKIRFEIPEAVKRVEKEGDLFEPVLKLKQKLPALDRLEDA
ncbi:MAG TPA: non-homologous end-joining DNA ligase [Solirubrobacterales bacterium]|nr:non-homologous end-joining DNA ligase [Solirubrobacterales bacterium]